MKSIYKEIMLKFISSDLILNEVYLHEDYVKIHKFWPNIEWSLFTWRLC